MRPKLVDEPNIRDRLQAIADNLPENGCITLTRAALLELLGKQPSSARAVDVVASRDLKTEEAAAAIYEVKPGTVLDWLHRGKFGDKGVCWYKFGRRYYIRPDALKAMCTQPEKPRERFTLPRQRAAGSVRQLSH